MKKNTFTWAVLTAFYFFSGFTAMAEAPQVDSVASLSLNSDRLAGGVYFVRAYTDAGIHTARFLK